MIGPTPAAPWLEFFRTSFRLLALGFAWLLLLWIVLVLFSGARSDALLFHLEALATVGVFGVWHFGVAGILLSLMGRLPRLKAAGVILAHQTVAFLPAQPVLLIVGLNYARQGPDVFVQLEPYTWPWYQFWIRGWCIAAPSYLVWGVVPTFAFSVLWLRERRISRPE